MPHPALFRVPAPLAALMLILAVLILPARARAWDQEADKLVARLAYERLDPPAKAKVDALLGAGTGGFKVAKTPCEAASLADGASLAVCLKDRRGADFMHNVVYDPLPICAVPPTKPPCADGRCASTALKLNIAVLKDPAAPSDAKALALMATAYLVSELHQPLHTADNNDRSGDRVRVTLPGTGNRKVSLYSVWDEDMPVSAIGDAETGLPYVRALAAVHGTEWAKGDVDSWVAETHQLAVSVVYGRLPKPPACRRLPDDVEALDRGYFGAALPLVRQQLAKAGVRLAAVLNAALD